MQPFLAMITPIGQSPEQPPGIWPGPHPSHPIMLPGMPGWGGGGPPSGPVDPGYSPPWARPPVDPGYSPPWARPGGPVDPGYSPPWARPGPPPGIWGPTDPRPTPPIYIPPPGSPPPLGIWGPPDMPPGFWGGGMGPGVKPQPHPEHPIVLPPNLPPVMPPEAGGGPIDWKVAWTPVTGWVVVGVPAEGTNVPTPSAERGGIRG